MKDRVPTKPNRVLITPEDGSAPQYATITRADEPTQEGTPLNKETLLSDEAAASIKRRTGFETNTISDVFNALGDETRIFTANREIIHQSTTWIAPISGKITLIGIGGGGGGAGAVSQIYASATPYVNHGAQGGAGGAGYVNRVDIVVKEGDELTIIIGAGGNGSNDAFLKTNGSGSFSAGKASDGGDTIVIHNGEEVMRCKGGKGGKGGHVNFASGSSIELIGGDGGDGGAGGGGGNCHYLFTTNYANAPTINMIGGNGGNAQFGGGGGGSITLSKISTATGGSMIGGNGGDSELSGAGAGGALYYALNAALPAAFVKRAGNGGNTPNYKGMICENDTTEDTTNINYHTMIWGGGGASQNEDAKNNVVKRKSVTWDTSSTPYKTSQMFSGRMFAKKIDDITNAIISFFPQFLYATPSLTLYTGELNVYGANNGAIGGNGIVGAISAAGQVNYQRNTQGGAGIGIIPFGVVNNKTFENILFGGGQDGNLSGQSQKYGGFGIFDFGRGGQASYIKTSASAEAGKGETGSSGFVGIMYV